MKMRKTEQAARRIQIIHEGLDLGFSDYYRDQNVRDRTIAKHLKLMEKAMAAFHLEEAINFSLFQTRGDEEPSANIYILDFPSDLRAAFYLLLGGYYRPALFTLRNWMEMRLLGIYFGRVEPNHKKYREWKLGDFEAPFGKGLIARLFARAEFQRVDSQFENRARLERLYKDLSTFTHGAALEKYNLQRDTDNVPRYNRASVGLWLKMFDRTFVEVVFSLFLAYGKDAFHALDRDEMKVLVAQLPSAYRNAIVVPNG
jgi:hypothetical protein